MMNRPGDNAGKQIKGGLNNLDANLDLQPFDSISNPARSTRDQNPITRLK
jgi:hypothetical protein